MELKARAIPDPIIFEPLLQIVTHILSVRDIENGLGEIFPLKEGTYQFSI
jgi:hypothetical protein